MRIRVGKKDDVRTVGPYLREMWLAHVDKEPKFINRKVIEESNQKEYFKHCFDGSEKSILLIAELDHEIIGILKINVEELQKFFNETKAFYLDDIYVVEKFRCQGVAKKLMKYSESLAKEKGIKWSKCRIYEFNKPAQNLVVGNGFEKLYAEYFKDLS